MAGALRKTMVYLGLAEDHDRYDDEYDEYELRRARQQRRGARRAPRAPAASPTCRTRTPVAQVVRDAEVGRLTRITTIHPRTYNEAKTIGESFRDGIPVIMNLTDMNDADAKRLVDFAAGLVFGLHGSIERVTSQGLPALAGDVEVNAEEGPRRGRAGASSTRADPGRPVARLT